MQATDACGFLLYLLAVVCLGARGLTFATPNDRGFSPASADVGTTWKHMLLTHQVRLLRARSAQTSRKAAWINYSATTAFQQRASAVTIFAFLVFVFGCWGLVEASHVPGTRGGRVIACP